MTHVRLIIGANKCLNIFIAYKGKSDNNVLIRCWYLLPGQKADN